ncbi:ABC-2 transporter permease [Clostridium senegalense]|uniref:ABC-2 transporter permease n=1 Tax=Clostridium senegalense TaxID=1465809 RepID=A0A6M0H7V0_9CLOT|nr:ABC-2 transporter permease [Clostridium senegalense]NEU06394.1 hypothetical protein [Clostridium senegalense]
MMIKSIGKEVKLQILNYKGYLNIMFLLLPIILMLLTNKGNYYNYLISMVAIANIATIQYEVRQKNHILFLSIGMSRDEYIISKFLGSAIIIIIGGILGFAINELLDKFIIKLPMDIFIKDAILTLIILLLSISIYYLIYYTLGNKVGMVAYFMVFMVIINIMFESKFSQYLKVFNGGQLLNNIQLLIFIILAIVIFMVIMYITVFFYRKKDF